MRAQIKYVFQIGYVESEHRTEAIEGFERSVADAASVCCGGCTTSIKTGWWKTDGSTRQDRFAGSLQQERCFELELTCEALKAERVLEEMKSLISLEASYHKINADWVHVSEYQITGRHFSINNTLNAMRAEAMA